MNQGLAQHKATEAENLNVRMPTKAQKLALVKSYAIYRESGRQGSGASIGQQQKLYKAYIKAQNRVLDALGARVPSVELQNELESAATRWWNDQAIKGAGKHW